MNHSKCKPRLEEHVLLPPRRCLAWVAGQAWDHSSPFLPLAPLSATMGLRAERDVPEKQSTAPASRKPSPVVLARLDPVSLLYALLVGSALRRQSHVHARQCQSPRALSGPGGALQGGGGSSAPTLLGGGGGGEREVRKVQTRYSPAKSPDWPHWQQFLPGKSWCQRGWLRFEDNPCSSDIQPPIVQHCHLIPPAPFSLHGAKEQTSITSTTNTDSNTAVLPRGHGGSLRELCCLGPGPVSFHRGAACLCWSEASSRPQRHSKQPA